MPDVYLGEPPGLAASSPSAPDRPVQVTAYARAAGQPWHQTVGGSPTELPGIATLWARRKIDHLIDGRVAGVDEALIPRLVVETALEHHLVRRYPSLVAAEKTPARAPAETLAQRMIDNRLPAGTQRLVALPQTATPPPLLRRLGAFLLLAATLLVAGPCFRTARTASGRDPGAARRP